MNLNYLREFVVLAEYRSFSKAAVVSNIAQPVLSKHIQTLEDELGVVLVDRTARPVSLTALGDVFLHDAMDIVARYDKAVRTIARLKRTKPQRLVFAATLQDPLTADFVSMARLALREEFPLLELVVSNFFGVSPIDDLESGLCDVCLNVCAGDESPNLRSVHLLSDPLMAIVPRENPLAQRQFLAPREFAGCTLYAVRDPFSTLANEYICRLFERCGISVNLLERVLPPNESYIYNFSDGVMIMPASACKSVAPSFATRYAMLPIDSEEFVIDRYLVYLANNPNPALPVFLREFERFGRQMLEG